MIDTVQLHISTAMVYSDYYIRIQICYIMKNIKIKNLFSNIKTQNNK